MIDREKISNIQLSALLISTMVGVGILSLPAVVGDKLQTDGWVLLIIGGILASILTAIVATVAKSYPGKTLVELGRELVTGPISIVISLIYALYFIGLSAFGVRVFAEVIKMFLLERTPTEIVIVTMLLTVSYLARGGLEGLARMALLLLPIVTVPIVLLFLFLLPDLDPTNMMPFFKFTLKDLIAGIPEVLFSFIGFEFLFIYIAFVGKPEKSTKYCVGSILVVTISYIGVFLVTLAQFGIKELTHQLWPTLSLMMTIELPGALIENVQGVVMALWVLAVLTTITPTLYCSSIIFSRIFKGKEHKFFVLPLVPIIYFVSLVPDNLATLYEYMDVFTRYVGTVTIVAVPLLYFMITLIKKKRKEAAKSGKNS